MSDAASLHPSADLHELESDRLRGPTRVIESQSPIPASQQDLVRKPVGMDWRLLTTIFALCTLGLVMAYSASYWVALRSGGPEHFLIRHISYLAIGTFVLLTFTCLPYQLLQRFASVLIVGAIVALVFVLNFGVVVNNSRRWLVLGGVRFQPAEFAKLAFVIYLARSVATKARRGVIETFKYGLLPHFIVFGLLSLLCIKQPDLGTALVLAVLLFTMTFTAGVRINSLMSIGGLAMAAFVVFVLNSPMRMARIVDGWLDVELNRHGVGFQLWNSKVAVAGGDIFGRGLGNSQQKLGFLPEAHTDFVLAIIGEELGLVGIIFVAMCFGYIIIRGQRIAMSARDEFGRILAIGITSLFAVQASINIGVVLGMLPTKGLTLPFVSYGG
ncbi:MAG TPA: hypothetical protein DCQ06_10155, partial [Myxococcales bacterium]|nr:hypothetical protein [Myxococcales bacterium]